VKNQVAVAFIPQVGSRTPSADAAKQLTDAIAKWASEGWTFVRLESITTVVNNGCLASLFGNATSTIHVQVAILERGVN
jgi:hypothetical protein